MATRVINWIETRFFIRTSKQKEAFRSVLSLKILTCSYIPNAKILARGTISYKFELFFIFLWRQKPCKRLGQSWYFVEISYQSFKMKTKFFFFNPSQSLDMFLVCSQFFLPLKPYVLIYFVLIKNDSKKIMYLLKKFIQTSTDFFYMIRSKRSQRAIFDKLTVLYSRKQLF